MRVGIPAYRLPPDILDAEIEDIKKAGVELKTGTRVESVDGLFAQGYDAVFIAVGGPSRGQARNRRRRQSRGHRCPVSLASGEFGPFPQGRQKGGCRRGRQFSSGWLTDRPPARRQRSNHRLSPDQRGDESLSRGNRGSHKRGCKDYPPCHSKPDNDRKTGSSRWNASAPSRAKKMQMAVPCRSRAAKFTVDSETVIVAVGQEPQIPSRFSLSLKGSTIQIAPESMVTSKTGVFAGADCVTGPDRSSRRSLPEGKPPTRSTDTWAARELLKKGGKHPWMRYRRRKQLTQPHSCRERNTAVARLGETQWFSFGRTAVILRNSRCGSKALFEMRPSDCSRCSKCRTCYICQLVCSLRSRVLDASKAAISIVPGVAGNGDPDIRISFENKCDACGLCARYCPFGALSRQNLGTCV